MPWPTAHTEESLATHLLAALGAVGTDLGLTAADLLTAVNDAIEDYGVADIALATDGRKLRAIARWRAWRWVVEQYIPQYDLTLDGQSLKRNQKVIAAAQYGLGLAAVEASAYVSTGGTVRSRPMVRSHDPYDVPSDPVATWP